MDDDDAAREGLLDSRATPRSDASSSSDTMTDDVRLGGVLADDDDDDEDDEDEDDSRLGLPRVAGFLDDDLAAATDDSAWKHARWVPRPVRRWWVATARWTRGPADARPLAIAPVWPAAQHAPLALLARVLPAERRARRRARRALLAGWLLLWAAAAAAVLARGRAAGEVPGWGVPGDIGCGNTYWVAGSGCGLDGSGCRPFGGSGFAFRCPASCAGYMVLNPRAVGDQEVVYRPLVVGGPGSGPGGDALAYRGDSFICGAAIHAGVVSNARGGCGVVRLVGQQSHFAASTRHGIASVGFDSYFPLAFTFEPDVACPSNNGGGGDVRWPLLAVSAVFSAGVSLFVTDAAAFFFSIVTGLFWHVGLASDPPPHASLAALVSDLAGKFLPTALAAWVLFDRMGVRRTLAGLTAQAEKTVLWLGACWAGALDNYTFAGLPIQRLTPHDLAQQPGAWAALAAVVAVLAGAAAWQAWCLRQEGRLRRFLRLYGLLAAALGAALLLPGLQVRIHHYVLALLLLPGTGLQTRASLAFQGLLVGLFLNGLARWGWDPVLQTAAALQGDAQLGSPLPVLAGGGPVVGNGSSPATLTFAVDPPPGARYDGLSVLVNDVERFRAYFEDAGAAAGAATTFVWQRTAAVAAAAVPEYFRFAFLEGSRSADYTRAGVWAADGTWVPMAPGASR